MKKEKYVKPKLMVIQLENAETICTGSTEQYQDEEYNPWQ